MSVETSSVFLPSLYAGKVAFVTGGGSGICKGMAEALMRHGAKTAIFSRTLPKLQKAASEMTASTGQECLALAGDVRSYVDLQKALKQAHDHFGRIDVVICGAAGNFLATAERISANGFKSVMDIDLIGTFNTAKAALPYLKETKGSVLSVSATFHYGGSALQAHCAAAKAGVDALTRTLAVEWGQYGIRVNAIAPGPIQETVGLAKLSLESDMDTMTRIPIQPTGRIRDIEHATLYILSDGARYVSGHVLVVDGGHWLTNAGVAPDHVWKGKDAKL
ncbi:hypothetical protein HKX48_004794 [Thoreauomyces humboldtii]|nr:hypothetical protein HKX48_004794 [Thoreauomyces humboldtii]